jgi:phosphatidylglycerophosphatase A
MPLVPGTFGSAAGILVFLLVKDNPALYASAFAVFCALGFAFCGDSEKVFKKKDPKYVVIDEVCGMLLCLAFLPQYSVTVLVSAFFIFRILDTTKAYPANVIQDMHGAVGIMGDDLVAGVYGNIVMQVLVRFFLPH